MASGMTAVGVVSHSSSSVFGSSLGSSKTSILCKDDDALLMFWGSASSIDAKKVDPIYHEMYGLYKCRLVYNI